VLLVISDITEFLGIACMTVRKKDANGNWRSAGEVDKEKKN
jgi:ethanolaminephosphotransferase